ncbi:PREDICTED: transcription initiation factor TFIID subunit 10-like [Acropora digitifera]|uniref:transcription initiation factor TFIID subunit 10-like n=1 Tax=Acropora digitifera TaxID=70779 RepID=UPI00077A7997|nr:PREDICTED: transcription initiation factor TFIID subunit 10-like [Acropora digitifera]
MADSVSTSTANSSQNKANPSVSQAQTSQPATSSSSTTAAPHVDTKVRNAGASLAEFLTQLEDYTPTVHFSLNYILNVIGISFCCVYMLDSRERYFRCSLGAEYTKIYILRILQDKRYTLTMEDLTPALSEYGITARKPPYFI